MKVTADRGPEQAATIKIKKISWLDRRRLGTPGRDGSLAGRLTAWNQDLWSPERILEALGLAETDLQLLKTLGGRVEGWHDFEFDARAGAEGRLLAGLGLIRLGRWRRRVCLTEDGRILLLLTYIDPDIK